MGREPILRLGTARRAHRLLPDRPRTCAWPTILAGYLLLRDVHRDVRLTEIRSQFVASVSHELKTPLTSIRMFAETLSLMEPFL